MCACFFLLFFFLLTLYLSWSSLSKSPANKAFQMCLCVFDRLFFLSVHQCEVLSKNVDFFSSELNLTVLIFYVLYNNITTTQTSIVISPPPPPLSPLRRCCRQRRRNVIGEKNHATLLLTRYSNDWV